MKNRLLVFAFFILCLNHGFSQKYVIHSLKQFDLDDVYGIDSLGENTFIVTASYPAKGVGSWRCFLVSEKGGKLVGEQMVPTELEAYYNMGRYFMHEGDIYLVRWKKGNVKKGELNRVYFDKMVDLNFPRGTTPVFESKEPLGEDVFSTDDKVYLFYKGGYRGGIMQNYKILKSVEHGISSMNVIQIDKDNFKKGLLLVDEFGEEDKKANLYGNYSLHENKMTVDNILRRSSNEIEIQVRSSSNSTLEINSYSGVLDFDLRSVITTSWIGSKYYLIVSDIDLNIHCLLLSLKGDGFQVVSKYMMPYSAVIEEYEKEKDGSFYPKELYAKQIDLFMTANEMHRFGDGLFVLTSFQKSTDQATYAVYDCFLTKIVKDEIIWVTNVARGMHVAPLKYVGNVIDGQRKNLTPKVSVDDDHIVLEEYETKSYFTDEVFRARSVFVAPNAMSKLYDVKILIDQSSGTIVREIIGEVNMFEKHKK